LFVFNQEVAENYYCLKNIDKNSDTIKNQDEIQANFKVVTN